ncbi:hypothetical protein [Pedobacter deserti]|uniref:hypothetical protein n=1 Tax=Pedobacter deserti TaxID=2817382 RepID=UPI00210AFDF0|nr:hypothetical protein [Pedobacter sp. SYSU D00382]
MRKLVNKIFFAFKMYPFSTGALSITLFFWSMVIIGFINIQLSPAPNGYHDYRGEGVMLGAFLALSLAAVLMAVTLLNITFQKKKDFYIWLVAANGAVSLICCLLLMS